MKASKALFVIGLLILVLGIVIIVIPMTVETWEQKEKPLVNTILTVPGGMSFFPLQNLIFMLEGSRNILVSGTVRELKGATFDLYAFDKRNYELWAAKASYKAYVEVKDVSSYSLSFSPTREDVTSLLYLVAVNKNSILGPSISVEYSIKIAWSERSYSAFLGGLFLGILLGGLGFVLIIVSAVVKVVFERREKEKISEPVAPATRAAPISEPKAKHCRECGTALTPIGTTGKSLCPKCERIYD